MTDPVLLFDRVASKQTLAEVFGGEYFHDAMYLLAMKMTTIVRQEFEAFGSMN